MARRKLRSPLGLYIVGALQGKLHDAARWIEGTAWGRLVERAALYTSHTQDERPHPLRSLRDRAGRRQWALALMLAERYRKGVSAGAAVAQHQLARRLGVSVRTVQRDLECLERVGLIKSWQPPAESLAPHLRGKLKTGPNGEQWQFAYKLYRWAEALPRELWVALQRWRVSASLPPAEAQPQPTPPQPYEPTSTVGAEAMARMRAAAAQQLAPDG